MAEARQLREHVEALLRMADESSSVEDRACLKSAAQEWLRIAEKLEREAGASSPAQVSRTSAAA